jgi:asparagine synthetase B (glutamine-hydrolysing)
MCGIAGGIWNDPKLTLDAEVVRGMTEAVAHRGPDDDGHFESEYCVRPPYESLPGVALGARRRLVLARDRLGQKPLVYRHEPDRLLFAREIKSLLKVPGVPRRVDPSAVDEYLTYQYVPHPNTIFAGIHKLPPAHVGIYCDGRFAVEPYWNPGWQREVDLPEAEYAERLRAELTRAVELRLQSDVPLGAFLSGGGVRRNRLRPSGRRSSADGSSRVSRRAECGRYAAKACAAF